MLTPKQAAERVGVSRPTIMTALKNKDLHGVRDNRNHWKIDPEDLSEWAEKRDSKRTVSDSVSVQSDVSEEFQELRVETSVLRERLAGRDALIEQLKSDLEHARRPWWRKILDRP